MSADIRFDWSKLDRNNIIYHVLSIEKEILSKKSHNVKDFHKILSNNLKSIAPVKVTKKYDLTAEKGSVYVGGCYYSDLDQENQKSIEIQITYNSKDTVLKVSRAGLKRISTLVADTILHEMMHMRQYRRRQFKSLPEYQSRAEKSELREEQAYLGSSDEIDAYSFNIACELYSRFNKNQSKIKRYLNKNLKNHKFKNSWRIYLKAFEYNHNHPIIKRLKKKVIRYLPMAELGKPYRTGDWINQ